MTRNFDIEHLITMVEARPVLWDKRLDTYKDKLTTKNAWAAIFREIDDGFDKRTEKEKNTFGKDVMKKWWNIRDGYVRACKKYKEATQCSAHVKKYVYHDQLQFLSKLSQGREPDDTITETVITEADTQQRPIQIDNRKPTFKRPTISKKRKIDPIYRKRMEVLGSPENRHLSFFKGIIPSLDKFDEDEVIEFQMGVLQLVSNINRQKRMKLTEQTANPAQFMTCSQFVSLPSQTQSQASSDQFYGNDGSVMLSTVNKFESNAEFSSNCSFGHVKDPLSPAPSTTSNNSTDSNCN